MAVVISLTNKDLQADEVRQLSAGKCPITETGLAGKLVLVKIGDSSRPACPSDVAEMETQIFNALRNVECRVIVTHHLVHIETH